MEESVDHDSGMASNFEEYTELLGDKARASRHLVNALLKRSSEQTRDELIQSTDTESDPGPDQGPMIFNA